MGMSDIRRTRGVPAKRGMRVIYTGSGVQEYGTIKSARGGYLRILLDGYKHSMSFHPTWELEYIKDGSQSDA